MTEERKNADIFSAASRSPSPQFSSGFRKYDDLSVTEVITLVNEIIARSPETLLSREKYNDLMHRIKNDKHSCGHDVIDLMVKSAFFRETDCSKGLPRDLEAPERIVIKDKRAP